MEEIKKSIRTEIKIFHENARKNGEDPILALLRFCQKIMEYSRAREQLGFYGLSTFNCKDMDIGSLVSTVLKSAKGRKEEAILFLCALKEASNLALESPDFDAPMEYS